jgi:hypothetical protein
VTIERSLIVLLAFQRHLISVKMFPIIPSECCTAIYMTAESDGPASGCRHRGDAIVSLTSSSQRIHRFASHLLSVSADDRSPQPKDKLYDDWIWSLHNPHHLAPLWHDNAAAGVMESNPPERRGANVSCSRGFMLRHCHAAVMKHHPACALAAK